MKNKEIIVVCGPTAAGKTAYAMALAEQIGAEIICLDAFQVYTDMDIMTAAPTDAEKTRVPHHLFGMLSPLENFSLSDYYYQTCTVIQNLWQAQKTPLLVGGTGLYLRTLQNGLITGGVPPNPTFRLEMEREAMEKGSVFLHQKLLVQEPEKAEKIHPNDLKRIIRALEILSASSVLTGSKVDLLKDSRWRKICLTKERSELYQNIEQRIDNMLKKGLIEEVKNLVLLGVTNLHTAAQALGFQETKAYLDGELSHENWLSLFKKNTRHFAKRQLTWLRSEKNLEYVTS